MESDGPNLIIDTGLPLYTDKDIVLAKLVFDLLIRFIEDEQPFEFFDPSESWYKTEWARLKEIYETVRSKDYFDDPFDEDIYKEATDLMVEIVKLRYLLWT